MVDRIRAIMINPFKMKLEEVYLPIDNLNVTLIQMIGGGGLEVAQIGNDVLVIDDCGLEAPLVGGRLLGFRFINSHYDFLAGVGVLMGIQGDVCVDVGASISEVEFAIQWMAAEEEKKSINVIHHPFQHLLVH